MTSKPTSKTKLCRGRCKRLPARCYGGQQQRCCSACPNGHSGACEARMRRAIAK